MNLLKDILELKSQQKHDSYMLSSVIKFMSFMLWDIGKLKDDVDKLNKRLEKLEEKE